jgi:NADPH:quinone reductase-like Zn-dependent oxidoreductase
LQGKAQQSTAATTQQRTAHRQKAGSPLANTLHNMCVVIHVVGNLQGKAQQATSAKHIVVTGASSGIGKAACQTLLQAGFHVFGSVRKESDGKTLQDEFGPRFTPLVFDVTDAKSVQKAADKASTYFMHVLCIVISCMATK